MNVREKRSQDQYVFCVKGKRKWWIEDWIISLLVNSAADCSILPARLLFSGKLLLCSSEFQLASFFLFFFSLF